MAACLLDYFSSFSINVMVFTIRIADRVLFTERVRDQFQRITVVMNFSVEVSEVESICDILLVNLTEVFIALAA